jgi:lipopolysaccharide transport system permease protein
LNAPRGDALVAPPQAGKRFDLPIASTGRPVGAGTGPFAPLLTVWHHRTLIGRLARRDIEARHRGSALGLLWSVLNPLIMMAAYTFIFTLVFRARWGSGGGGGTAEFSVLMFSGMVLFTIFAECVNRAPGLMMENPSYIKKVVFPLEIMPVVVLLSALFNAAIGFVILMVFSLVVMGLPPPTILLLPLVLLPLCLFTLGLTWVVSAAGVFLRDLRQVVTVLVTVSMFLSPIFYPLSAVPEGARALILVNPLAILLERSKDVMFWGHGLPPVEWTLVCLGSLVWAWLGHTFFVKTRQGFADVV